MSLIILDLVVRVNKKYYPQTLLGERKYEIKKNKMENLINDNLDSRSSGESDNETKKHSKKSDMNLIVISLLKIEIVFNNEKSLIMCVIMLY